MWADCVVHETETGSLLFHIGDTLRLHVRLKHLLYWYPSPEPPSWAGTPEKKDGEDA